MTERPVHETRNEGVREKGTGYVGTPIVLTSVPAMGIPITEARSSFEEFTRGDFEGALGKVSRPTGRGKLAHARTSSDEFARRKQEEIELEERSR